MTREHAKSPAVAGRLESSPLPELLAYALNHRFTGALVLESVGRPRSGVYFEAGAVSRARAAGMEQALARQALGETKLPEEDLVLAARFAHESKRDIFTAVEHLALLTRPDLERCRSRFVERQVQILSKLPNDSVYGFFPELSTLKKAPGPDEPLSTFSLIISSILDEVSLTRVREQLEPFKTERMTPVATASQDLLGPSASVARTIIARLRRSPHSFEELRLLNFAPERELIASVYALRLTRRVSLEETGSLRPSLTPGVARRASGQALRAARHHEAGASEFPQEPRDTLPEVGYPSERDSEPPRVSDSELPRVRYSEAQQKRYWQEQTAEGKALEAWANAESGDPNDIKRGMHVIEKAIEFFPNNPQIRFYAGCLYRRARHLDRAATEFRRVLSIDPHNLEAKRELESIGRQSLPPPNKSVFGRLLKKR